MMGGFNSGTNSGTNSNDIEPMLQLLTKQSQEYVITDFCNFIVQYLENGEPVAKSKYLSWPVKGNVIRGVYHPSEPSGALSMIVGTSIKSEKVTITIKNESNTDQQIEVSIKSVKIDGRDLMFSLGCSYGESKTVPWEVKLENSTYNFKTTISGYLTITYEAL